MSSFDLKPGDVIVTTRADYTSYQITYLSLARRLGVVIKHAEDLAEAVRDNALTRSRLQKELSGLRAFQQRRDLSVADMIALSQQVSKLEAQVEVADQEAAQQRRRIQTQKVSLHFEAPGGESGRGEIRQAVRDFFATLASGTAWTIRAVAFLIPVLVVFSILVAAWRRLRRRRA